MSDPWTSAMREGDFARAWRISDASLAEVRWPPDPPWPPRHLQRLWDGRSFDGRHVLVHCYHGLGDTLQFVRLLPLLRERASRVSLWVQPALMPVLENLPGADALLPLHEGDPGIERDVDIELMELPHALRIEVHNLPRDVPYLPCLPARPHRRRAGSARLAVGLVWRGGDWDEGRNVPGSLLEPLGELPQVDWYSLQLDAETPAFCAGSLACRGLREQAQRLAGLDLVVSVDTALAHLAGALGLPTWLMLRADCDWRWMRGRSDSPWYPTMRLFRQGREGDWPAVVRQVRDGIAALGRGHPI